MSTNGGETLVKDQALVDRRHAQICEAALRLFSRKGFHQTSVREIAEATLRISDEYRDEALLLYRESYAVGRQGLEALFEVDRRYVGGFREILERGIRRGQLRAPEPHLLAVCILFLCAVWPLKRWNLKPYTLDTLTLAVATLVLQGVGTRGAPEPAGE